MPLNLRKTLENTHITTIVVFTCLAAEIILTTKYLTPSEFGIYSQLSLAHAFSFIFGTGWIYQINLKHNVEKNNLLRYEIKLSIFHTILTISVLYLTNFKWDNLFILIPLIYLRCTSGIIINFAEAKILKFGKHKNLNFSQSIASIISIILLLIIFNTLDEKKWEILLLSVIIKELLIFILGKSYDVHISDNIKDINLKTFREFYGYSLASFFGYIYQNIDKWLTLTYLGVNLFGIYSRAIQITNIPTTIIGRLLTRDIQAKFLQHKWGGEIKKIILKFLAFTLICWLLYILAIFTIKNTSLIYLIPDEWKNTITPLKILSATIIIKSLSKLIDVIIRSYYNHKLYYKSYLISSLTQVTIIYIVAPKTLSEICYAVIVGQFMSLSLISALLILSSKNN